MLVLPFALFSRRSFVKNFSTVLSALALFVGAFQAQCQAQTPIAPKHSARSAAVHRSRLSSRHAAISKRMIGPRNESFGGASLEGAFSFSPSTAAFGNVVLGTTSQPIAVTATNNTSGPVSFISESSLREFGFQAGTCGSIDPSMTLGPGQSCTFDVTFSPTSLGAVNGSFTLGTAAGQVTFPMTGTGVPATVVFSPASAAFGIVMVGSTSQPVNITASNYTSAPASFIGASGLDEFSFQGGTCGPIGPGVTLAAGQSCNFNAVFSPTAPGSASGSFSIGTSAGPVTFNLTGTGMSALAVSTVSSTANPQVAAYSLTLPSSGAVTVDFGPEDSYGFATSARRSAAGGGPVTVLVAGMKANTTYHMRASVQYDDGSSELDRDHTFTTGSIPAGFLPKFTVETTPGLTPQPGVELVDLLAGATPSIPFATDMQGNVVWTYLSPDQKPGLNVYPIKLLPNGHFMFLIAVNSFAPPPPGTVDVVREIDLAGSTVRQLSMDDLNTSLAAAGFNLTLQVFSHDFTLLPNGHLLVMANTVRAMTDLPGYPGVTNVLGDVIVDLDQNLKPVWLWNEFDHFDVNRHPMGLPDWTHSNAVTYSPDDGNFLVSMRHQNWVVKVDYRNGAGSGAVLWKLGQAGDYTLKGGVDPTDWFYAQHDPNFVSANTTGVFTLALMDNGNDRMFAAGCGGSDAPPCQYSTAQVMQVDENAKTATLLFLDKPNIYSFFAGSNRVLPNSNVEFNLAGVGADAFTYEVTPTATPQTVWEMHLIGSNTYRSFRMPSLYPGVQW